jgi:hypothetical protein
MAKAADILTEIGNKAIEMLKESLQNVDRVASSRLSQSIIAMPVRVFNQSLILEIKMEEYWKFVDRGVDGTQVSHGSPYKFKSGKTLPSQPMLRHIANRGEKYDPIVSQMIAKRKRKPLSRDKARKSLAFALGVNIRRRGIKPTNFASDVFEKIEVMGEKMMSDFLKRKIELEIKTWQ